MKCDLLKCNINCKNRYFFVFQQNVLKISMHYENLFLICISTLKIKKTTDESKSPIVIKFSIFSESLYTKPGFVHKK